MELSSDGGPEFIAKETESFLKRWGVRHRLSSVAFPSSNGRAELAVKLTKRLLMNNVSTNGDLKSKVKLFLETSPKFKKSDWEKLTSTKEKLQYLLPLS